MSQRTLLPIFVFWAILTIITPTLILLSENSKADLDAIGNATEGMKARRMIGYTHNHVIRPTPPSPAAAESVVAQEEETSAPAPSPTWSLSSHQNHSLASNKTDHDHGLTLSTIRMQVKVEQTDIR